MKRIQLLQDAPFAPAPGRPKARRAATSVIASRHPERGFDRVREKASTLPGIRVIASGRLQHRHHLSFPQQGHPLRAARIRFDQFVGLDKVDETHTAMSSLDHSCGDRSCFKYTSPFQNSIVSCPGCTINNPH